MSNYIGIDLGTTNSAICSFDGKDVRIWKSPEQNDVTPSAIYIDKRGNRYYGQRAYENAPRYPESSATLFKRFLGTSEKIHIKNLDADLTPEECSAEILRVLFGYLPEEIRNDKDTAVVITVPAAFNQMKKNATLEAAKMAGFENVALMQEPVAAVMSVMRKSKIDGIFVIYDLGGGTFDVSIAENIGGKVNVLAHGGVEMCGGRDIDRILFNNVVVPWLRENFSMPEDFLANQEYNSLKRLAQFACEKAKIELSAKDNAYITMDEGYIRTADLNGDEIYLDIAISRDELDGFIEEIVKQTVEATRDTMKKAGLTSNDIEKLIFVGGPTNYKHLRDAVCEELSLPADISVNPMTAVAEGASIFAESVDWTSEKHGRKETTGEVVTNIDVTFKYTARSATSSAKVIALVGGNTKVTAEINSVDTGWSSGRFELINGKAFELPLDKNGENEFVVKIYDAQGKQVTLANDRIVISRTIATIGAIPASQSLGFEVLNKLGGETVLEYILKEGEDLPKKGSVTFKAGETIKAGSANTLNMKLWEGNIEYPIEDNRFVGCFSFGGNDFDEGVIATGAEIICEYEVGDSGTLQFVVSVPSIGATLTGKNFYSKQAGEKDVLDTDKISEDGQAVVERINQMNSKVNDERLDEAKKKANKAASIGNEICSSEDVQEANNSLLESKKLINEVRKDNLKVMRQMDLDNCVDFFNENIRQYAKPNEEEAFDNQAQEAQREIDRNGSNFENLLDQLRGKNFDIMWRQDFFVIDWFRVKTRNPANFSDRNAFEQLKQRGEQCIREGRIEDLRKIFWQLTSIEINESSFEDVASKTNIIRG